MIIITKVIGKAIARAVKRSWYVLKQLLIQ